MNIGINLLAFTPGISGGIEFYARNLLASLVKVDSKNQFFAFTNSDNYDAFQLTDPNFHRVRVNVSARPQIKRIIWEQAFLPVLARKFRLDVLHSPSYTWPILSGVPGVVTICDMIYKIYPESVGQPKLTFWRLFVPWSAQRCKRVLTISEYSKRDIVRHLRIAPDKVVVTLLAPDKELSIGPGRVDEKILAALCATYGIKRPYVLTVGGVGQHKNPFALVRALNILHHKPATEDLHLVITGNNYGAKQEIKAMATSLGLNEFVSLPGYVAKEDLPIIYAGSVVYASPSYFEGFGLTLLEAMACGAPVVTSDRASLPEVAGNAALVINPDRDEELADAIYRIASDSKFREGLILRGYRRVKDFSWDQTARRTLQAYEEAIR